jgi:hypothetical protein
MKQNNMKQNKTSDSMKQTTVLEMIGTCGQMISDIEVQNFYASLDGLADTQKIGLTKARLAVEALHSSNAGVEADELLEALELLRDARKSRPAMQRPLPDLRPTH